MTLKPVNLADKLAKFSDQWSPKIIAEMNDHQFKLARFYGEFVWHTHADTDEVFIVLDGSMTVHFRNGDVSVHTGELFVVPRRSWRGRSTNCLSGLPSESFDCSVGTSDDLTILWFATRW